MTILCYSITNVDWLIACFACIFNYFSYQICTFADMVIFIVKRLLNVVKLNNSNKSDLKPSNDAGGIVYHLSRENVLEFI